LSRGKPNAFGENPDPVLFDLPSVSELEVSL
jgi:hypothetical protein